MELVSAVRRPRPVGLGEIADWLEGPPGGVEPGLLADARDWDALERLFSDQVRVDYASLFGG